MPSREQFLSDLRTGLDSLYDPERLRRSPLAELFGVGKRFDTPVALRRILTEAIASLEPSSGEPLHSARRQSYEILLYRYVERLGPKEIADQLAMGDRHLRRKQQAALEALADQLWEQFDLDLRSRDGAEASTSASPPQADLTISKDLAWLKDAVPDAPTHLGETLLSIAGLADRLASRHNVRLDVEVGCVLPDTPVPAVALRQILLNLLSVAVPRAAKSQVRLGATIQRWQVEVMVTCPASPGDAKPVLSHEAAILNETQQLAELCGCRLSLHVDARAFEAHVIVPALEQWPVLVVDDNADALSLFQRYVTGTRYRLIPTQAPEEAVALAQKHAPVIIVIDVMMPTVDGWELLDRLGRDESTVKIPVIVSTILGQKEMALLMGASAFLQKPVTRTDFLAALDQQLDRLAQECP